MCVTEREQTICRESDPVGKAVSERITRRKRACERTRMKMKQRDTYGKNRIEKVFSVRRR